MTIVVIAPDSFKGSITATDAARAIATGWASERPGDELVLLPQADGGEGTVDALSAPGTRAHRRVTRVTGPDGRPVQAEWVLLPDGTAIVELAQSSGLPQMAAVDALGATTRGLGEVLTAALDAGATSVVIGLGGSASTDGGAGALQALGLRLTDARGTELEPGGGALAGLASVDASALRPPPPGGVTLLSDVTNPLLGDRGAAATFAPQKGAGPADVAALEDSLTAWSHALGGDPSAPGAGAAGGTGYGFATLWGARLVSGSEHLARLTRLESVAATADVLITGEGRFDATSLGGKVVGHALGLGAKRVVVIAGLIDSAPDGVETVALTELAGSAEASLADPARWLQAAGARAAGAQAARSA